MDDRITPLEAATITRVLAFAEAMLLPVSDDNGRLVQLIREPTESSTDCGCSCRVTRVMQNIVEMEIHHCEEHGGNHKVELFVVLAKNREVGIAPLNATATREYGPKLRPVPSFRPAVH
ncbi:MAG: hypothetical protein GYA36_19490 [Veillonellaceae bacterium]|nr:hypothetical protein [Veillonellaceae bacterium]